MEERFKAMERKLAALTKTCETENIDFLDTEDIGTDRGWISDLKDIVSFTT